MKLAGEILHTTKNLRSSLSCKGKNEEVESLKEEVKRLKSEVEHLTSCLSEAKTEGNF
jgi:archaellum component FlaC